MKTLTEIRKYLKDNSKEYSKMLLLFGVCTLAYVNLLLVVEKKGK